MRGGGVHCPVAGAAHALVAALLEALVGAVLVRRLVGLADVVLPPAIAEDVLEALGAEIALLLGHPLLQAEMRRDDELAHGRCSSCCENIRSDKKEKAVPCPFRCPRRARRASSTCSRPCRRSSPRRRPIARRARS